MGGLPQEGFYTVARIVFNGHLRDQPIARPSGDVIDAFKRSIAMEKETDEETNKEREPQPQNGVVHASCRDAVRNLRR